MWSVLKEHFGNVQLVGGAVNISKLEQCFAVPRILNCRLSEILEGLLQVAGLSVSSSGKQQVDVIVLILIVQLLQKLNAFLTLKLRLDKVTDDKFQILVHRQILFSPGIHKQSLTLFLGCLLKGVSMYQLAAYLFRFSIQRVCLL